MPPGGPDKQRKVASPAVAYTQYPCSTSDVYRTSQAGRSSQQFASKYCRVGSECVVSTGSGQRLYPLLPMIIQILSKRPCPQNESGRPGVRAISLYYRHRPSHADAWATGRPQPRSNPSDVGQQPRRGKGTRPGASRGRRGARMGAILAQARA